MQAAAGEDRRGPPRRRGGAARGQVLDRPREVLRRVARRGPAPSAAGCRSRARRPRRPRDARTRSRRVPARRSRRRSPPASRARRTGSRCGRASRARGGRASRGARRPRGSARRRAADRRALPRRPLASRYEASPRPGVTKSSRSIGRIVPRRVHRLGVRTRAAARTMCRWRRSATRRRMEQFHPTTCSTGASRPRAAGFEAGFMVSEHFHPWTPQQGQSGVRLELHGRARRCGRRSASGPPSRVPGFRYHPAVDRPRRGDARRDVPGPVLARARRRRGAQRARHRRRVAGDRRPLGDDVRGDRDHRQAVHRPGREAPRAALQAREREAVHAARRSPSRSTSRRPARSTRRRPASSPRA